MRANPLFPKIQIFKFKTEISLIKKIIGCIKGPTSVSLLKTTVNILPKLTYSEIIYQT